MSYEEMGSAKHPCPCGKGTYTVTHFMDDWNRSKYEEKMNCTDCRKKYVLDSYATYDSGLATTATRWIKASDNKKANQLERNAEKLNKKAEKLAKVRYLNLWLEYFSKIGDKKKIWEKLTFNGSKYPSLGTFYKHIKPNGVKEYLKGYFNLDNSEDFDVIMKIMNTKDIEIAKLFKSAEQLIEKAEDTRRK